MTLRAIANHLFLSHGASRSGALPVDPFWLAAHEGVVLEDMTGLPPHLCRTEAALVLARHLLRETCGTRAQALAGEILVPAGSLQMLVIDRGIVDMGTLAGHFGVEEALVRSRLQADGLLP
jgi:hypothetical protein